MEKGKWISHILISAGMKLGNKKKFRCGIPANNVPFRAKLETKQNYVLWQKPTNNRTDMWLAFIKTVMNVLVPQKINSFSLAQRTVSLWRTSLLHGFHQLLRFTLIQVVIYSEIRGSHSGKDDVCGFWRQALLLVATNISKKLTASIFRVQRD